MAFQTRTLRIVTAGEARLFASRRRTEGFVRLPAGQGQEELPGAVHEVPRNSLTRFVLRCLRHRRFSRSIHRYREFLEDIAVGAAWLWVNLKS